VHNYFDVTVKDNNEIIIFTSDSQTTFAKGGLPYIEQQRLEHDLQDVFDINVSSVIKGVENEVGYKYTGAKKGTITIEARNNVHSVLYATGEITTLQKETEEIIKVIESTLTLAGWLKGTFKERSEEESIKEQLFPEGLEEAMGAKNTLTKEEMKGIILDRAKQEITQAVEDMYKGTNGIVQYITTTKRIDGHCNILLDDLLQLKEKITKIIEAL